MKAVLVLVFVACALAQSTPCQLPTTFQAEMASLNFNLEDTTQSFAAGTIWIDQKQQALRFDFFASKGDKNAMGTVYEFFDKSTGFYLDRNSSKCYQFSVDGSLNIGIPKNATFSGYANVGTQQISNYYIVGSSGYTSIAVTSFSCLPVSVYNFNTTTTGSVQLSSFANYADVINNIPLFIFQVPQTCSSAKILKRGMPVPHPIINHKFV